MSIPATQTVIFGALTRAGHGGHKLGYIGAGTLAITAGTNAAHWTINDRNQLVPAGTYGSAPTATLAGPYTLTVSDGTDTSTVTITLQANTYSVSARTGGSSTGGVNGAPDTSSVYQLRSAFGLAVYGDSIQIQDGEVIGDDTTQWSLRRPTTPTGFTGENHIVIRPTTALGATIVSMKLDGDDLKRCDGVRFQSLKFRSLQPLVPMLTSAYPNGADFVDVWDCDFEGNPASLFSTDLPDGILNASNVIANRWRIRRNRINGVGKGIYLSNPATKIDASGAALTTVEADHASSTGIAHEVSSNTLSRIGYDEINITNATGAIVTDNTFFDKWAAVKPYPDTAGATSTSTLSPYNTGTGGQPHGDGIQIDYASIKFGSVDGAVIERNVWLRGSGRDTMPWYTTANYGATDSDGLTPNPLAPFPDSQGIFVTNNGTDKTARGAVSGAGGYACVVKNPVIRNNGYLRGMVRGISVEFCENPVIEFNTVLAEKSVPLLPSIASAGQISATNISGTTGRIRGNIASLITTSFRLGGSLTTPDNVPVTYADNYATTFAAPAHGPSMKSLAAWKAGFKPKPIGTASLGASKFAGMLFPDASFNSGTTYAGVTMTKQVSTALLNGIANAYEATIGASPRLRIYSGTQPAATTDAAAGTLLAEAVLPSDWMSAASGGTSTLLGSWTDAANDATGTASYYRLVASDGTTVHEQGSVGTSGADLNLSSTTLTAGGSFTVTTWSRTGAVT